MSRISLEPNSSGSGVFTIASPNSNTSRTLTLPDATGTINTSGAINTVPAGTVSAPSITATGDTNTGIYFPAADTIGFVEGGAEAMRITSGGEVYIGTEAAIAPAPARLSIPFIGATNYGVAIKNTSATTGSAVIFLRDNGSGVGSIDVSTTATAYVTSSDYRLKENIVPMTGALAKVALLKPCTYTWKIDGSDGQGFIAHELTEVVPQAVTGEKDAVNADGSIKPQGIDTSFLVATLTAAIQELKAELDTVKAELATLKGT